MKYRTMALAVYLGFSSVLLAQSVYPGRFRDNMMRDSAWMASIEVNRLLHSSRTHAGVLLSAYGLMYAATGSEVFKQKGDSLVRGTPTTIMFRQT